MLEMTRGLRPTWLVPLRDVARYRLAGAARVVGVLGGLCAARNVALERAFLTDAWCLQLDDDLRKLTMLRGEAAEPVTVGAAATAVIEAMGDAGSRLGGVAPTSNPFFGGAGRIKTHAFIIASFLVAAPSPLRFDTSLPLKEDWDFTCQHLATYGSVARRDDVMATFLHYSNAGGVQRYRTDAAEVAATEVLLARWPQYLRAHARRPHELALRRPAPL